MKIKIDKKQLDEIIRLYRKWDETKDKDILDLFFKRAEKLPKLKTYYPNNAYNYLIVSCLEMKSNCSNETIYKVFEILGFELIKE